MNLNRALAPVSQISDLIRDRWADAPWFARWIVYAAVVLFAVFVLPSESMAPIMSPHTDWVTTLWNPIGLYILLALGLNIVVGQAGLLDLGYVAFFAIGAYSVGVLGGLHGWPFWWTVLAALLLAAVSGIVLGAPTLRLRGDYLAIVTLGFGEIIRIVARNTTAIGDSRGISDLPRPPDMFGLTFVAVLDASAFYYLILTMIILVIIVSVRLNKSRVGRAWAAIREDEDAAELMGVPTFRFKLLAFFVGAMIGGLAGTGQMGGTTGFIQPEQFTFILSATILVCVVFGGSGNIPGVILGAFIIAWLPERFRGLQEYRYMAFGAVLVAMMILRPEGLLPSRRRKAELQEGTGGMGSLGAEVATPAGHEEVSK
ncbi:branched-chain amino acid ABC transporter permease [Thermomonospora umbrina]|uniref:Amino acid/amide ABC transporter membrane protein 2 (HAAT family) n=1 Tax=Thermomonospora umbrina TaxID=111806 RepID=A0A3D9T3D9_9ACTN|nr:branched-chain amino acid ABC transporter permease [Thermomonospora umbrina]REE99775.1 amino acid/amide ABC transporter membrane protein 2 (HAAT family) [Thermomonospora umbrina]